MIRAILDASAVIALLMNETGADRVGPIAAESGISTVNLSEVVGYLTRNGADEAIIREMLHGLHLETIPFDDEQAHAAGLLLPLTRRAGLSLGDRACLALARRFKVKAVTTDRAWSEIAQPIGVKIDVIR